MKTGIDEASSLSFCRRFREGLKRAVSRLSRPFLRPVLGHLDLQKTQIDEVLRVLKDVEVAQGNLQAQGSLHAHKTNDVSTRLECVMLRTNEFGERLDGAMHRIEDLASSVDGVVQQIIQDNDNAQSTQSDISARLVSMDHLIRHIEATSVSRFDYLEADRNILRQLNGDEAGNVAQRIRTIGKLLRPHTAVGRRKVRLGGAADGGYVCLDDFHEIKAALSFGTDQDVSWDLAIASEGIVVHQFDHTVAGPPIQHPNFRFSMTKISPTIQDGEESIGSILASRGWNEPASVVLKIDIEGDEWDVFDAATIDELDTFSQIICELHGFQFVENDEFYQKCVRVLSKIGKLFRVVHVHGNNFCAMFLLGGVPFPSLLEVTYVNVRRCGFFDSTEIFPTALDGPNNPTRPDFFLGGFTF